ncbi:MAG: hypothetical protein RLY20_2219 [Verrucomicrobiota bacterium]
MTTLLGLTLAAQAGSIKFDISPAGADAAVGLAAANQVPAVTNSTGSGNELGAGISFDTNSLILTVNVGFGSAAGFTDLTAPASALHIHGPAAPGANGPVVVDLQPYLFSPVDPAKGGIIFGQVSIPTNDVADLLAGLNYINIHTTNNPGGEIRGQLIPILNHAPVLECPAPATVECGGATSITAKVSDEDSDALTVVWSVNGVGIQTNSLAAGTTSTPKDKVFTAEFPLGTNTVAVTVTDASGASASCSTTVIVVDTIPPVITSSKATPSVLWPPNHKMIPIKVDATVTDICGATTWKIISITSSEAPLAVGSGNTSVDWQITGDHTAKLRAERSGVTGPRIYTITIQAKDASGNLSEPKAVTVTVPHNK